MEKNGGGECGQPGYLGFVNGTMGPSSIVVVGIHARFSMLAMTPPPRPYLMVGTPWPFIDCRGGHPRLFINRGCSWPFLETGDSPMALYRGG